MNIVVKNTTDMDSALKVAVQSRDYFESGFGTLKKDLKEHLLFAAFKDNKMVGFVTFKKNNPEVVEISWLAVTPSLRGKGIGSKLVNKSLVMLKGKYKIVEVKTLAETHKDPGYAKTRNFYKSLGFVPLEIISPYPGWGEDNPCQIFTKSLR